MVSVRAALLGIGLILGTVPGLRAASLLSEAEVAEQEKGFDAAQHATLSFRARIQQKLTLNGVDQPIVSTGELFYQAPDRLLIRFSDPAGEWMRIEGNQLDVKKAGHEPFHRDLSQGGSNATTLLDFFTGDSARWHRDFTVSMRRSADSLFVSLTPLRRSEGAPQASGILTALQLPDYEVKWIMVSLNDGNTLNFRFLDGHRNAHIDPQLFQTP